MCRQTGTHAIILLQKVWTWANHKVGSNLGAMKEFYSTEERNYSKYFGGGKTDIVLVLFVLFIPLVAVTIFDLHNKCKMPHECCVCLKAYLLSTRTFQFGPCI
jgi:hypothetical protein